MAFTSWKLNFPIFFLKYCANFVKLHTVKLRETRIQKIIRSGLY